MSCKSYFIDFFHRLSRYIVTILWRFKETTWEFTFKSQIWNKPIFQIFLVYSFVIFYTNMIGPICDHLNVYLDINLMPLNVMKPPNPSYYQFVLQYSSVAAAAGFKVRTVQEVYIYIHIYVVLYQSTCLLKQARILVLIKLFSLELGFFLNELIENK